MKFGQFPAEWLAIWILSFAIWLGIVGMIEIIKDAIWGERLPLPPDSEEEREEVRDE